MHSQIRSAPAARQVTPHESCRPLQSVCAHSYAEVIGISLAAAVGDGQMMLGASLQVGAEACRASRRGRHSCGPHCQSTLKARPARTQQRIQSGVRELSRRKAGSSRLGPFAVSLGSLALAHPCAEDQLPVDEGVLGRNLSNQDPHHELILAHQLCSSPCDFAKSGQDAILHQHLMLHCAP